MLVYLFTWPPAPGAAALDIRSVTQTRSLSYRSFLPASLTRMTELGPFDDSYASCVIAFADLHGDLKQAHAVLKAVGASNETHLWAAGSCTLVQTGDLVDRGPESLAVTQLFEDIKAEAKAAGGKVVNLLGNHELMNLMVCSCSASCSFGWE
jgi:hypothetical protein